MSIDWKTAVRSALWKYSDRHATIQIDRTNFLSEEQENIVRLTGSTGKTPGQTISRVLQELRDDGDLFFSNSGRYALRNRPLDISIEDAPADILEDAIAAGTLLLKDVETSDTVAQVRIRQGMNALRKATLLNYQETCALCDIHDASLLVTSHIARWSDQADARGLLANTICFCSFHDRLFEFGYFSLDNDLEVIRKANISSNCVKTWLDDCTFKFRHSSVMPSQKYLADHRKRTGFD